MNAEDKIRLAYMIIFSYDIFFIWIFASVFLRLHKKKLWLYVIGMIIADVFVCSILGQAIHDVVMERWSGMEFIVEHMLFFLSGYIKLTIFEGEFLKKIFVVASRLVLQDMLDFFLTYIFQMKVEYHNQLYMGETTQEEAVGICFLLCVLETVIVLVIKLFFYKKRRVQVVQFYNAQMFLWGIALAIFLYIGSLLIHSLDAPENWDIETIAQSALGEISVIVNILVALITQLILLRRQMREEYERRDEMAVKEQYYNQLEENQKEIRKIRHDIKNQLLAICGTVNPQEEIAGILREIALTERINISGNAVVNAIISAKQKMESDLKINWRMQVNLPEQMNLTTPELGVLYGNLLDNAIEACRECGDGERYIEFNSIVFRDSLVISCKNSMKKYRGRKHLLTTKKDKRNHGIGLRSVQEIVEQYNGDMVCHYEETEFLIELNIWLD